MVDATYPLFPIFSFLGFIVSLIPLPWHLQAWNSGTCYYMMWSALACLNQFVNSVAWAGNVVNHSPAWCEISIRILMASSVALPAASLCINRRLYQIAGGQVVNFGRAEKFRAVLIDTLICVLFPLIFAALQYVVQGHRFNIFEDIGCYPALYNTLLRYFISSMWPIVIGVISAAYGIMSLRAFYRRRLEFSRILKSSNSSLTMGRYFRLMALAMTDILLTTPLAIFIIWLNATVSPVQPWRGWEDTHFNYSRIDQIPAVFWKNKRTFVMIMELTRWLAPLCAFVFFAFFGFADEAKRYYTKLFSRAILPLGLKFGRFGKDSYAAEKSRTISFPATTASTKLSYLPSLSSTNLPSPSSPQDFVIVINSVGPPTIPYADCRDKINENRRDDSALSPTATSSESETQCNEPSLQPSSWRPNFLLFSGRRHSSCF